MALGSKQWLAGFALSLAPIGAAQAYTLELSSQEQGWSALRLEVHVDPTVCGIPEADLDSAVDQAISLWNSIPTSALTLVRAASPSVSVTQATQGTAASGPLTPLILCDPHFGATIGDDPNLVPAVTVPKATNGTRIDYAYLLLNSQAGAQDSLAMLPKSVIPIIIAHELGHVLGLGHATDPSALMYYNLSARVDLRLSQDDMDGITFLYPRTEPGNSKVLGCGLVDPRGGPGSRRGHKNGSDSPWSGGLASALGDSGDLAAEVALWLTACALGTWIFRFKTRIRIV